MAEYIECEAFISWLKTIPLKDLSDGKGLCKVIFEEDFKRAIKNMPSGCIADVVPRAELAVRSFQDAATIEDLQKKLAVATEALKYIFSDLKKEIHDKAVFPNCHGVEPYVSLKVFDAVINKLIGS